MKKKSGLPALLVFVLGIQAISPYWQEAGLPVAG